MWDLWKNSFLQEAGKPQEIWKEFRLSQVSHEHSLPSPLSAPIAHVLDAAVHLSCSFSSSQHSGNMHLCFGYISWEGQQINRQEWARQEQSSSGQTKSAKQRAKGTWGTRQEEDWSESCRSHNESWEILATGAGESEGPEEAREPKGSLVRSGSVVWVCLISLGTYVREASFLSRVTRGSAGESPESINKLSWGYKESGVRTTVSMSLLSFLLLLIWQREYLVWCCRAQTSEGGRETPAHSQLLPP